MGISYVDIKNMCDKMDKEDLSKAMALTILNLGENGVSIEYNPSPEYIEISNFEKMPWDRTGFNDGFEIDFSKHDEQLRSEWQKEKDNFSNILSRMTPEARKAIESGELLGTQFITCAELGKIKIENKELKSQCECLKKEIEELCSADSELIDEPIRIAEKLIYATRKCPVSQIQKAFGCKGDMVDVDVYDKSDLRQIAKHLLVYCDNEEGEE